MTPTDPSQGRELGPTERLIVLCAADVCPHEPKHQPLPALFLGDVSNSVLTRWELSDEERAAVASGADLWIWQEGVWLGSFPPILPTFEPPREGESCPECRHGKPHNRLALGGSRFLGNVGCQFCPCVSGWIPEEEKL